MGCHPGLAGSGTCLQAEEPPRAQIPPVPPQPEKGRQVSEAGEAGEAGAWGALEISTRSQWQKGGQPHPAPWQTACWQQGFRASFGYNDWDTGSSSGTSGQRWRGGPESAPQCTLLPRPRVCHKCLVTQAGS